MSDKIKITVGLSNPEKEEITFEIGKEHFVNLFTEIIPGIRERLAKLEGRQAVIILLIVAVAISSVSDVLMRMFG